MKHRFGAALVALCLLVCSSAHAADTVIYDGLLVPEMGTIERAMIQRGQHVQRLWHDAEEAQTACPAYLVGHSMGGNAALRQAARCAAAGHPPRAVVTIDPGRAPLYHTCAPGLRCWNYYDPQHAIGGQIIDGARNIIVPGFTHLQLPSVPRVVDGVLAATR
jgi:thioesterase domain-containing protein